MALPGELGEWESRKIGAVQVQLTSQKRMSVSFYMRLDKGKGPGKVVRGGDSIGSCNVLLVAKV